MLPSWCHKVRAQSKALNLGSGTNCSSFAGSAVDFGTWPAVFAVILLLCAHLFGLKGRKIRYYRTPHREINYKSSRTPGTNYANCTENRVRAFFISQRGGSPRSRAGRPAPGTRAPCHMSWSRDQGFGKLGLGSRVSSRWFYVEGPRSRVHRLGLGLRG
eukprot:3084404-Rhodomonas_salina.2